MNSVNLIGRTTKEIELKYVPSGTAVAKFSIAIGKTYQKDGEKVEEVSFIEIQCWGKTAENVSKYVAKGHKIGVTGFLKQDRWETDAGKRSKLYVVAMTVEFLEGKSKETNNNQEDDTGWDD